MLSVTSEPSLRITHPAGIGSPAREATSILPRGAMDVAASKRKGKDSSVGALKAMGLVPSIGSTPKVGAMEGCALVTLIPTIPSLAAMVA